MQGPPTTGADLITRLPPPFLSSSGGTHVLVARCRFGATLVPVIGMAEDIYYLLMRSNVLTNVRVTYYR